MTTEGTTPEGTGAQPAATPAPPPAPSAPAPSQTDQAIIEKLHFPMQDGEKVLSLQRRHWMYLWPWTVCMALLAFVPIAVMSWLLSLMDFRDADGFVTRVFWGIALLWLVYWLIRALFNWYRYTNDIWVITNQRIVDSLKKTPWNMRMSTADLVNIQDMTVERHGPLQTMLDYGDIVCKTASDGAEFTLSGIPHPSEVQALVDKERDRERTRGR